MWFHNMLDSFVPMDAKRKTAHCVPTKCVKDYNTTWNLSTKKKRMSDVPNVANVSSQTVSWRYIWELTRERSPFLATSVIAPSRRVGNSRTTKYPNIIMVVFPLLVWLVDVKSVYRRNVNIMCTSATHTLHLPTCCNFSKYFFYSTSSNPNVWWIFFDVKTSKRNRNKNFWIFRKSAFDKLQHFHTRRRVSKCKYSACGCKIIKLTACWKGCRNIVGSGCICIAQSWWAMSLNIS